MRNKILKIFLFILALLIIILFVKMAMSKKKNNNTYKNNFYNNNIQKIDESDYKIGDIKLNMSADEVKQVLGEPDEKSEFVDSENPESSYKRFDYENLIIQFDYEKEYVNYIASSNSKYKNIRGIGVNDTVTDILKNYYADKKIEIYENSYGRYEILYNSEDAINYLNDMTSTGKTFAYIYKYNNEINSIIFVENGRVIEFYIKDNKVNMEIVAEKYIPW